jgi:GGDEF domain-containing protein
MVIHRHNVDGLTGIANRKTFDVTLCRQATTSLKNGDVFSLFVVYLGFLKEFNKKHGENIGNQSIKLGLNFQNPPHCGGTPVTWP